MEDLFGDNFYYVMNLEVYFSFILRAIWEKSS